MASPFIPLERVRWTVPEPHLSASPTECDAVVVRANEKQVLIRARDVDGRLLYRWVSPKTLRKVCGEES
jgi:hypothetical protein